MKNMVLNTMLYCIILIILLVIIENSDASEIKYKAFIGKSITYYNSEGSQINKNEHLGRLKDQLKSAHVGITTFKEKAFISCSTNRVFQQPVKIRFSGGKIERKTLNDSCSTGYTFISPVGNVSPAIIISNANIYDNYQGAITKKSAVLAGLGFGLFKDNNYYGLYWFDRNNEFNIKNAFGIVYNKYF